MGNRGQATGGGRPPALGSAQLSSTGARVDPPVPPTPPHLLCPGQGWGARVCVCVCVCVPVCVCPGEGGGQPPTLAAGRRVPVAPPGEAPLPAPGRRGRSPNPEGARRGRAGGSPSTPSPAPPAAGPAPPPRRAPPPARPPGVTWALEPSSGGRRVPSGLAVVCRLMGPLCGGSTPAALQPSPPLRCAVTIAMGALAGRTEMARLCPGLPLGLPPPPPPPGALRSAGTPPGLALPLAPLPTSTAAGQLRTASFCRGREGEREAASSPAGLRPDPGPPPRSPGPPPSPAADADLGVLPLSGGFFFFLNTVFFLERTAGRAGERLGFPYALGNSWLHSEGGAGVQGLF